MRCNNCNMETNTESGVCPNCGSVLGGELTTRISNLPVKKRIPKKFIILGVIAAIIIIIIASSDSGNSSSSKLSSDYGKSAAASYMYISDFNAPKFSHESFHKAPLEDFMFGYVNTYTKFYKHRNNRTLNYHGDDTGNIIIPEKDEDGHKIKALDNSFINSEISGVFIPDCITLLDTDSFYGCENLKVVEFEGDIDDIGSAFSDCTSLEKIKLPNGFKTLNSRTFTGCTSLKYVELPDSVEKIDEDAIILCGDQVFLYVPDSVTSIDEDAFGDEVVLVVKHGSYAEKYAKMREQEIIDRKGGNSNSNDNQSNESYYDQGEIEYPDYGGKSVICPKCDGSGSFRCSSCDGSGSLVRTKNTPNYGYGSGESYTIESSCPACGGDGEVDCYACGGDGVID